MTTASVELGESTRTTEHRSVGRTWLTFSTAILRIFSSSREEVAAWVMSRSIAMRSAMRRSRSPAVSGDRARAGVELSPFIFAPIFLDFLGTDQHSVRESAATPLRGPAVLRDAGPPGEFPDFRPGHGPENPERRRAPARAAPCMHAPAPLPRLAPRHRAPPRPFPPAPGPPRIAASPGQPSPRPGPGTEPSPGEPA